MKKTNFKNIFGYIEGYYGNLLNWRSRKRIIKKMSSVGMNFYFYAPKEDLFHRLNWRKSYNLEWRKKFRNFCEFASQHNVKIIAGISPGIDFNYLSRIKENNSYFKKDLDALLIKFNNFLNDGATNIALLFDDIPQEANMRFYKNEEGKLHAQISNIVSKNLHKNIFLVPRIYADELISENKGYLKDLLNELNKNIHLFYCGKYVINDKFETNSKLIKKSDKEKRIIFWDNYYANDYCPKKLYLGPWLINKDLKKVMVNLTGMIETDLLIIEMVAMCRNSDDKINAWKNTLKKYDIPEEFFKLYKFFDKPHLTKNKFNSDIIIDYNIFNNLDVLIWRWKTPLSREWYPYLLSLKQDLQILCNKLPSIRILKTQTYPIAKKIINN